MATESGGDVSPRSASHWRGRRGGLLAGVAVAAVVALLAVTAIGEHHVVAKAEQTNLSAASASSGKSCPWVAASDGTTAKRVRQLEAKATKSQLASLLYLEGPKSGDPYEGWTPAMPSLCLPQITEDDDRIGVHAMGEKSGSSLLPAPIDLGSSFDTSLAGAYGDVLGNQARSQGVDFASSTMVNVVRSSDFGRTSEVIGGEDPLLNAVLGAAEVKGVQSQGEGAILLHMTAYAQAQGRATPGKDNSVVSPTALQEVYLAPFSAIVRASQPKAIMAAYNDIDGVPAAADVALHDDLVAWSGSNPVPFVRSDCLLLPDDQAGETAADLSQAKCGPNNEPSVMVKLSKATLERLATPVLTAAFGLKLLQDPSKGKPGDVTAAEKAQGQAVALKTADEGTVLLKNHDSVLPLSKTSTVALIGTDQYPDSQGSVMLTAPAGTVGDVGGLAQVWAKRLTSVPIPVDSRVAHGDLPWTEDPTGQSITSAVITKAVAAAKKAHTAVVVASMDSSEWWDHKSLALSGPQISLIDAVAAVNRRTIVVLNDGGAVLTSGWGSKVAGIIDQWYPGEQGGTALAAILDGSSNPSGKLPVTFPTSNTAQPAASGTDQMDPSNGQADVSFSEGADVGYRWYVEHHVTPAYPFGYGLSYSRFHIVSEHVTATTGDAVTVTGTITNTSSRAGTDVAQVYLTKQPAASGAPAISLVAFERVAVSAHGSAQVSVRIPAGDVSTWDQTSGRWVINAGDYDFALGDSVAHLPQSKTVRLSGIRSRLRGITVSS
jgi:beta-glucosidase